MGGLLVFGAIVVPAVICGLKGKWWMIILFPLLGACRLAKPDSWWARRFYNPEKQARASMRFATPAGRVMANVLDDWDDRRRALESGELSVEAPTASVVAAVPGLDKVPADEVTGLQAMAHAGWVWRQSERACYRPKAMPALLDAARAAGGDEPGAALRATAEAEWSVTPPPSIEGSTSGYYSAAGTTVRDRLGLGQLPDGHALAAFRWGLRVYEAEAALEAVAGTA
jgi:hypothetical protein